MLPYRVTIADTTTDWLLVVMPSGHTLRWRPWAIHCLDHQPSGAL